MTITKQSDEFIENLVSKIPELTRHYTAKEDQIFETVRRKRTISPLHNFGRLLRELFVYTPRCHTGFSLGKQYILLLFISEINT
jgi:hypothetical protein